MSDLAARCANHPGDTAIATCTRCGVFTCARDTANLDGIAYCVPCSKRPDVDRVEAYRISCQGQRSAIEWAFILAMPLQLVLGTVALYKSSDPRAVVGGALGLLSAANAALWFNGKVAARRFHLALVGAWAVTVAVLLWGESAAVALLGAALAVPFGLAPLLALRSKLFFGLPVSRQELRQLLGYR
ncbi:MAG: hypothetical protein QM723_14665 [Myxococcaceae bacterium]